MSKAELRKEVNGLIDKAMEEMEHTVLVLLASFNKAVGEADIEDGKPSGAKTKAS